MFSIGRLSSRYERTASENANSASRHAGSCATLIPDYTAKTKEPPLQSRRLSSRLAQAISVRTDAVRAFFSTREILALTMDENNVNHREIRRTDYAFL